MTMRVAYVADMNDLAAVHGLRIARSLLDGDERVLDVGTLC